MLHRPGQDVSPSLLSAGIPQPSETLLQVGFTPGTGLRAESPAKIERYGEDMGWDTCSRQQLKEAGPRFGWVPPWP